MEKKRILLDIGVFLLFAVLLLGLMAYASGPEEGGPGAMGNIAACSALNTENEIYTLTANVQAAGACMVITANNVTLNCNGFTINYSASSSGNGVASSANFSNVRNCNLRGINAINGYGYGINLTNAHNATIFNNSITANGTDFNYGIFIFGSSNNISGNAINTRGTGSDNVGIYIISLSNRIAYNRITTNGTSSNYGIGVGNGVSDVSRQVISWNNITASGSDTRNYGISLEISSTNSNVTSNTITTSGTDQNRGIAIFAGSHIIAYNNITAAGTGIESDGIYFQSGSNNNLTGNTINANITDSWAISSISSSNNFFLNNIIKGLSSAYDVNATFRYSGDISIKNVISRPYSSMQNISKYLNITNSTEASVFLNISYTDAEISGISESTLNIWKHNSTVWNLVAGSGINTAENYVYANLTNFSVFAPLGMPPININITYPFNQSYAISAQTINATTGENATCFYSLNGAANASMDGNGTVFGKGFTAIQGGNTATVSCNDTMNNWNASSIAFTVTIAAYCGDGTCNGAETCSSCSTDCGVCSTGGTTGGGGGSSSEKTKADFNNLKAGVETEKQLLDKNTAFTKIAITSDEDIKSLKISIEKQEKMPEYAKNPKGKVYELLDIKLDTNASVKAKLCFSVKDEWLKENEAKKENVALAHYNPRIVYKLKPEMLSEKEMKVSFAAEQEDWEELPTKIVKQEQKGKIDYCAEATEFSMYAIIAKEPELVEFIIVIKPVVEEQIIAPQLVIKKRKGIDWRALRNWIMGSIDAILILLLFTIIMFGDTLFPEGINIPFPQIKMPSFHEIKLPSIERMPPAPKPSLIEPSFPIIPASPAELPKPPAKHELPANYKKILLGFARDSLLKGYSENDVRNEMSKHYIADESIDSIINQCYSKICIMSKYELLPHVIDMVMRGYSAADINRIYVKNGVLSRCIESVIKIACREISAASKKSLLPFANKCFTKRMPASEIINLLVKHGVNKTAAESLVRKAHSLILKKQRHLK